MEPYDPGLDPGELGGVGEGLCPVDSAQPSPNGRGNFSKFVVRPDARFNPVERRLADRLLVPGIGWCGQLRQLSGHGQGGSLHLVQINEHVEITGFQRAGGIVDETLDHRAGHMDGVQPVAGQFHGKDGQLHSRHCLVRADFERTRCADACIAGVQDKCPHRDGMARAGGNDR